MSDSNPLQDLLQGINLGPAWAKKSPDARTSHSPKEPRNERSTRTFDKHRDHSTPPNRRFSRDEHQPHTPRPVFTPAEPAHNVRVQFHPDPDAIHLITKEIQQTSRVHSLFEIAQTLLAERSRCRITFNTTDESTLVTAKFTPAAWLSRDEALTATWTQPDLRTLVFDQQEIDVEPPTGNITSVARCGISGIWLGPPNIHTYQPLIRQIHREKFPHLTFEQYSAKIHTERSEEAIEAWKLSASKQTQYRLKNQPDSNWLSSDPEAQQALREKFDELFTESTIASTNGSLSGKHLSPSLLTSLRIAASHTRKHPALLIPEICQLLEKDGNPIFKRQGKLFTGPSRPHVLSPDTILSERLTSMVQCLKASEKPRLKTFWKTILPESENDQIPDEWLADFQWLLKQGHVLLFLDGSIIVPERKIAQPEQTPAPATTKTKKKRRNKRKPFRTLAQKRNVILSRKDARDLKQLPDTPFRNAIRNRTIRRSHIRAALDDFAGI